MYHRKDMGLKTYITLAEFETSAADQALNKVTFCF